MLKVKNFVFNGFMENTYVVHNESEGVVIDPGCYTPEECKELEEYVNSQDIVIKQLLNTHCHVDHVLGNAFVKNKWNVPLLIHQKDEETLRSVSTYAATYGFPMYSAIEQDGFLSEEDKVKIGSDTLDILFVPGHAPGHIAFYNKDYKFCIGGDVLFENSIGRTDLPGGDYNTLIKSIKEKMFNLPDETVIYSGHGAETSIGHEKEFNPFCGKNVVG